MYSLRQERALSGGALGRARVVAGRGRGARTRPRTGRRVGHGGEPNPRRLVQSGAGGGLSRRRRRVASPRWGRARRGDGRRVQWRVETGGRPRAAHTRLAPAVSTIQLAEPGVIPCIRRTSRLRSPSAAPTRRAHVLEPFEAEGARRGLPGGRARPRSDVRARSPPQTGLRMRRGLPSTRRPSSTPAHRNPSRRLAPRWSAGSWNAARSRSAPLARAWRRLCGPSTGSARRWSARARAELVRVVGEHDTATELTPTEVRVADLVAEGKDRTARLPTSCS